MNLTDAKQTGQWRKVCRVDDIPALGARVVHSQDVRIAVFRGDGDAVFALEDRCPHKGGPLSQGIVFGTQVSCPLHGWLVGLHDGEAVSPDRGCVRRFAVRVENGEVFLQL